MQIAELLGGRMKRERQLYGIEIEVENVRNAGWTDDPNSGWRMVQDGSLRNHGMEFITAPCTYKVQLRNIENYYNGARRNGYTPSIRTGIHIHADMRWRTLEQVAAICALYAAVEPALFGLCGPDREECIYCVPWYRSMDDANQLLEMLNDGRPERVLAMLDGTCKYSALYLEPLKRFGTIEFRAAPTFSSVEEMRGWMSVIDRLVRLGHRFGTPEKVAAALAADKLPRILEILFPTDQIPAMIEEIAACDSVGVASRLVRTRRESSWAFNIEEPLADTRRYHEVAHRRRDAPPPRRGPPPIWHREPEPEDFGFEDEEDDN